jgi:hypothetical protein
VKIINLSKTSPPTLSLYMPPLPHTNKQFPIPNQQHTAQTCGEHLIAFIASQDGSSCHETALDTKAPKTTKNFYGTRSAKRKLQERVVIHLERKFLPVPLNTRLKPVRLGHHHPRSVILFKIFTEPHFPLHLQDPSQILQFRQNFLLSQLMP